MDRLNILHKVLLITVAAVFIVNQAMFLRIERELHDALPELRIRNAVVRQGAGNLDRVTVTLRDDRTIEGYIDDITDEGFTVVDRFTGENKELAFRIVKDIRVGKSSEDLVARGLTKTARVIESLAGSDQ